MKLRSNTNDEITGLFYFDDFGKNILRLQSTD